MSQYTVLLDVNHLSGVAHMSITQENGERPSSNRQRYFSPDIAQRIATADGKYSLDDAELKGTLENAMTWMKVVQKEFLRRLVSRKNQLVFNGGVVHDAKDSRTRSVHDFGSYTIFIFTVEGVEGD